MKIANLIWGKVSSTIATVALAVFGLFGAPGKRWDWEQALLDNRPWKWIFALGAFLILHSWVSGRRERRRYQGRSNRIETMQGAVLHLIRDLAELSGRRYDLWIIDVYLKRDVWRLCRSWPFLQKRVLERQLSMSLADVTKLPSRVRLKGNLFGRCFDGVKEGIWWDPEMVTAEVEGRSSIVNLAGDVEQSLPEWCAVVKVWPITDRRRQRCRGLLVVHAKREIEVATKALGVLAATSADRYLQRAGEEIFEHLRD